MQRFFGLLVFCALLASTPILPAAQYDLCCDGKYYATIEGLYWRVNHSPIGVAKRSNQSSVDPEGKSSASYLFGDYDGGVRGRIGYQMCALFADLSYLHFCTEEKRDVSVSDFNVMFVNGNAPRDDFFDFVSGKSRFRYQNVDLRFGYTFCQSGCFQSFAFVNARWLRVDSKIQFDGLYDDGDRFQTRQQGRFNGGALGLGIGGHYALCGNFGIESTANLMAVIGETKFDYANLDEKLSYGPFFNNSWDHVEPGFEFRLGVDYSCCISCFDLTFAVGYELDYYPNLLFYFSNLEPNTPASLRMAPLTSQDISFAGPFFRLTAGF